MPCEHNRHSTRHEHLGKSYIAPPDLPFHTQSAVRPSSNEYGYAGAIMTNQLLQTWQTASTSTSSRLNFEEREMSTADTLPPRADSNTSKTSSDGTR